LIINKKAPRGFFMQGAKIMKRVAYLIELFQESNLTELSYQGEFSLVLKKGNIDTDSKPLNLISQSKKSPTKLPSPSPSANNYVTSPSVGTFYQSASPDEAPFIKIGDNIMVGQVIGIIEAMKVMTEVKSDQAGKVTDILVKNGEMVEFGSKLIEVEHV